MYSTMYFHNPTHSIFRPSFKDYRSLPNCIQIRDHLATFAKNSLFIKKYSVHLFSLSQLDNEEVLNLSEFFCTDDFSIKILKKEISRIMRYIVVWVKLCDYRSLSYELVIVWMLLILYYFKIFSSNYIS